MVPTLSKGRSTTSSAWEIFRELEERGGLSNLNFLSKDNRNGSYLQQSDQTVLMMPTNYVHKKKKPPYSAGMANFY